MGVKYIQHKKTYMDGDTIVRYSNTENDATNKCLLYIRYFDKCCIRLLCDVVGGRLSGLYFPISDCRIVDVLIEILNEFFINNNILDLHGILDSNIYNHMGWDGIDSNFRDGVCILISISTKGLVI